MKGGSLLIVLLVVAVIAATALHIHKAGTENNDINKLAAGYEKMKVIATAGNGIFFQRVDLNPDQYLWSRYLLAPRFLSLYEVEKYDTILYLTSLRAADSVRNSVKSKRLIWENRDDQFGYILICGKK